MGSCSSLGRGGGGHRGTPSRSAAQACARRLAPGESTVPPIACALRGGEGGRGDEWMYTLIRPQAMPQALYKG